MSSQDKPSSATQSSRLGPQKLAGPPSPNEDQARTGGRGFLLITGAKVWFMIMGAIATIGLPVLMSAADFGVYNIIVNIVGLLNMVVITGSLQSVSKLVSQQPGQGTRVLRKAFLLQACIAMPLAAAYIIGAPWIAEIFADPSLTPLIQISGGVTISYAFYALLVGYLNGRKAFGRQAMLDIAFSTMKTGFIVALVVSGFGVAGALWGFVAAAVAIVFLSAFMVWRFMRTDPDTATEEVQAQADTGKQLLRYLFWIMTYTFCIYGVLRADLFLLKGLVGSQGGTTNFSNEIAGIYGAMQYVSRLPFQAVIAVTFVVFPMLSRATFEEDGEATRVYIRSTLRYSLLLLALLSTLIAGNAPDIIQVLYGDGYLEGAIAMMVLGAATVGYALFYISTTMITGAGRPEASAGIAAMTLIITVAFNVVLINQGMGEEIMATQWLCVLASAATALAMILGFAMSLLYLHHRYRAHMSLGTTWRVIVSSGATLGFLLVAQAPDTLGRIARLGVLVGKGAFGVIIFVAVLALLREFTQEDRARLRRVLKRTP